jgi:hypothetical protein
LKEKEKKRKQEGRKKFQRMYFRKVVKAQKEESSSL